jgi:hypothetical protein
MPPNQLFLFVYKFNKSLFKKMYQNESSKPQKSKLTIKIKNRGKYKKIKPEIIINDKIDLNKISLNDIINVDLLKFSGTYFNKLYEKARYEEIMDNYEKLSLKGCSILRYKSKNNELYKIDEEEYNEMKKLKKENRSIKSDNSINSTKHKTEQILNQITNTNCSFKLQKINFEIKFDTFIGQSISIIGSIDKLGNWDEYKALNMNWTEGNIWKANIEHDDIKSFEYKFIFMENGAIKKWEDGINRIFSFSQIKNILEPNLISGKIIKLNNIMNQSIEYNYNDYSLTIISEWNKKSM